ncbi:MAG: PAS domain-containing sensor histidine kinase [bacterium]
MAIDIRTLILILGISHLVQAIVFYYQYRIHKTYKGIGWWLLWCSAEILGFGCVLLRGFSFILPVIIIIQNVAIISGTIFIYIGICRFFGRRENLKIIIPVSAFFLLSLIYFLFVRDDIHWRSAIIAITLSFMAFLTAQVLLKQQIQSIRATVYFNATIFILHGIFLIYRCIVIIVGNPDLNVYSSTFFQTSLYLDALIVGLLWTYGFIIMVNQRLNAEMTESKERFESIFNTSPDASLITRMNDGLIADINNSFTLLTGYTMKEAIGNSSLQFLWKNPDDRIKVINELREKGFCDNFEATFLRKDSTELTGLMSARMITLEGNPYIISVTRNITERKQAENSLRESEAKLKELNATKDKFFSIIAHDLLNPFNTILGFMEVIIQDYEEMDKAQIHDYLKIVDTSSRQAFTLLENLLLWARSHTGSIDFRPDSVDIQKNVEDVIDLLKTQAEKKEVSISSEIKDQFIVTADKNMIDTILRNLLTNALKFSFRKGKITVSAKKTNGCIEISVRDNGLGITREDIVNIFRIDNKTSTLGTDKEKGSGLGLILCKEFVEKNGGRIWVESEFGRGSIFKFTIPFDNDRNKSGQPYSV